MASSLYPHNSITLMLTNDVKQSRQFFHFCNRTLPAINTCCDV